MAQFPDLVAWLGGMNRMAPCLWLDCMAWLHGLVAWPGCMAWLRADVDTDELAGQGFGDTAPVRIDLTHFTVFCTHGFCVIGLLR